MDQTGGLLGIDLFLPTSLLPLPWQDGRGPRQRTAPFSVGGSSTQKKGIQGSGMGS